MLVIPAIDLKDGKVIRLLQGKYEEVTVYSHDPVETAKSWQEQGAGRIHIVDLDGAKEGKPINFDVIKEIRNNTEVILQLGGGIRTIEHIKKY